MKRWYQGALCVLLLAPSILVAQDEFVQTHTISGYVRDADSGEELIGVNVRIKDSRLGMATNEYGFYSLTLLRGTWTISASYIGYQTVEKEIYLDADTTLHIELLPSVIQIQEVVAVGATESKNITSIEMSVAELTAATIRQVPVVLGEADLVKTLTLLPGVSRTNEASSGFSIRGSGPAQNLVLLDESIIYNASHLFGFFSVFNPDAIKEVKLYKGGINARYGGRLASVLDVRQKEGNKKSFLFKCGLGLAASRFLLEGPIRKEQWSFLVGARRSYADLFLKLANNDNIAYFYDLNLKSNYSPNERNRFFLSGYFGRDSFEFADVFGNSWGNAAFTLRWNHLFNDRIFSNISLIYSTYNYASEFYTAAPYRWSADIENVDLKMDGYYYINTRNAIDFGFGLIHHAFNPGTIVPLDDSPIQKARLDKKYALEPYAYLSYDQKLSPRLEIQYGMRLSSFQRLGRQNIPLYENGSPVVYNSDLGLYEEGRVVGSEAFGSWETMESFFGLEPRLSLKYQVSRPASIKCSYNRTRQYIQFISNTASSSPLDIWAPSGPFIPPQRADQIALGYFRDIRDGTFECSLEGYYKRLYDLVDYVPGADLMMNNHIETEILSGDGRAYGCELQVKKSRGRLNGWLSYTLSRSEQRVPGVSPSDPGVNNGRYYASVYDRPHDFSLSVVYRFNTTWDMAFNCILSSGRPTTYPESRYEYDGIIVPHFEERNGERFPYYNRIDISFTLKEKWGGDWIFSLYNVFNRKNASFIRFQQVEDSALETEAIRLALFGIVPSITYDVTF